MGAALVVCVFMVMGGGAGLEWEEVGATEATTTEVAPGMVLVMVVVEVSVSSE